MALIKCWECEKEISNSAKSCPSCGAKSKVKNTSSSPLIILLPIIIISIFLVKDYTDEFKISKYIFNYFENGSQTQQDIHAIRNVLSPTPEQQIINEQKAFEQAKIYQQQINAQTNRYDTLGNQQQIDDLLKQLKAN
jgi:hypothetical protein